MSRKSQAEIRLGTTAFTAAGWEGKFYPRGMKSGDAIIHYSKHFDTVEVDSTFYRTPRASVVKNWYEKTPKDFVFTAKIPREITHEHVLENCESDLKAFVRAMEPLGEKLGPLLIQFPYFNKKAFSSQADFMKRLRPFLKKLPKACRFALEVRNKNWLTEELAETLQKHKVALTMVDHAWMPRPREVLERINPITTDFTYVRWLGDRKGIEKRTKVWNKTIIEREDEMSDWVEILKGFHKRKIRIYAFANNHYSGYAPDTVNLFRELWR